MSPIRSAARYLLAFCAFAALTGLLGAYAVTNVMGSGQLVVETYDKPLMAISYARLALTNFGAMELAQAQRQLTQDAASRLEFDAQIDTLAAALDENISVAQRRSLSQRATDAAKATAAEVAKWETLRRRLLSVGREGAEETAALDQQAKSVIGDFDNLVELTAEDGFKFRESALRSIATYRELSLAATIAALLLGALVAFELTHRMVRPIAAASRAARRIAEGELDVEIAATGGDELGQLLKSMAIMRDNIRAMMEREIAARRSAQGRLVAAIESSR